MTETHHCAFPERFSDPNTHVVDFDHMPHDHCVAALHAFTRGAIADSSSSSGALPIMGADMEWTTRVVEGSKKRITGRVAVLQLCTASHALVLRSETPLGDFLVGDAPRPIREALHALLDLLRNPAIFKVGVGIAGDKSKLHEDYGVDLAPCVDIVCLRNDVVAAGAAAKGAGAASLKNLTLEHLGVTLAKVKEITISDWGDRTAPLRREQIEYALDDVCASYELARKLLQLRIDGEAESPTPLELLTPLIDKVPPSRSTAASSQQQASKKGPKPEPAVLPGQGWFCGRQTRYYDNIRVVAENGEMFFTVDKTKAEWYLKKDLAVVTKRSTDDGELEEIRLTFTPNFGRFGDSHLHRNLDYFRAPKENKCVVCASDDALVRHSIVPTAYRKFMPAAYVSHNSYDMVLVCVTCFPKLTHHYERERHVVAEEFGFPLTTNGRDAADGAVSEEARRAVAERQRVHDLIKNASALHRFYRSKQRVAIPPERVAEMEAFVREAAGDYVYPPMVRKLKKATRTVASRDPAAAAAVRREQPISIAGLDPLSLEALGIMMVADPLRVARVGEAQQQLLLQQSSSDDEEEDAGGDLSPPMLKDGDIEPLRTRDHTGRLPRVVPAATTHAMHVVRHLIEKGEAEDAAHGRVMIAGVEASHVDLHLGAFVLRWRSHFLRTMQPKHMPPHWTPDSGVLVTDEVMARFGLAERSEQKALDWADGTSS